MLRMRVVASLHETEHGLCGGGNQAQKYNRQELSGSHRVHSTAKLVRRGLRIGRCQSCVPCQHTAAHKWTYNAAPIKKVRSTPGDGNNAIQPDQPSNIDTSAKTRIVNPYIGRCEEK